MCRAPAYAGPHAHSLTGGMGVRAAVSPSSLRGLLGASFTYATGMLGAGFASGAEVAAWFSGHGPRALPLLGVCAALLTFTGGLLVLAAAVAGAEDPYRLARWALPRALWSSVQASLAAAFALGLGVSLAVLSRLLAEAAPGGHGLAAALVLTLAASALPPGTLGAVGAALAGGVVLSHGVALAVRPPSPPPPAGRGDAWQVALLFPLYNAVFALTLAPAAAQRAGSPARAALAGAGGGALLSAVLLVSAVSLARAGAGPGHPLPLLLLHPGGAAAPLRLLVGLAALTFGAGNARALAQWLPGRTAWARGGALLVGGVLARVGAMALIWRGYPLLAAAGALVVAGSVRRLLAEGGEGREGE